MKFPLASTDIPRLNLLYDSRDVFFENTTLPSLSLRICGFLLGHSRTAAFSMRFSSAVIMASAPGATVFKNPMNISCMSS